MTPSTLALLDQTELQHLAMQASDAGDSGQAIAYLKEATARVDGTAVAHYLLGAQYAEIALYDRAVGEMEAALALDPSLATARLQLGLLWLTSGVGGRASEVFAPLDDLPASDPIRLFGNGLRALIDDEFDLALQLLQEGIRLNDANPALNRNMQRIIDEVVRVRGAGADAPVEPTDAAGQGGHHLLLSAYTGNTGH